MADTVRVLVADGLGDGTGAGALAAGAVLMSRVASTATATSRTMMTARPATARRRRGTAPDASDSATLTPAGSRSMTSRQNAVVEDRISSFPASCPLSKIGYSVLFSQVPRGSALL